MKFSLFLGTLWLAVVLVAIPEETIARSLPKPRPDHPGNIFLAGEDVVLRVSDAAGRWLFVDYEDRPAATLQAAEGGLNLGRLQVGFYRGRHDGQSNWVSCAVLPPLRVPTPLTSPVALDVAMAWFYPKEKMDGAASLCALAGVNWVRDRLSWGEIEPKKGQFAESTRYDQSALAQAKAGLQVLQVLHMSPSWANPVTKRFPLDLRDAYRFHRELARRWRGQVQAFEPWNEADIPMFGGHTGSEMATIQKASYLGLKAGRPDVIAGQNVWASHNRAQLEDLRDNAAWPYFDTFNLHHYAGFDEYPRLYADFRAVSAGRPLWVSECAVPVKWTGDEKLKEPTDADLRVQAERVAKTFACSLHEGSVATFYFLLPHYVEGQTQFGLLRPDLTPRPAYVALAAVGRLLADAKPLGRWQDVPDRVRGFLFRAAPGGQSRDVLVAWATTGQTDLALPVVPDAMFDHLGRNRPATNRLGLTTAPLLVLLPEGAEKQFQLRLPPAVPERLPGEPSPVVIQALWPEEKIVLSKSAYRLSSQKGETVPLFVYNFSDSPVTGHLNVTAPKGWKSGQFDRLQIAPQSRVELRLELDCREAVTPRLVESVSVAGDFGAAGKPVLSMRVLPEPALVSRQAGLPIPEALEASRWQPMISGGGALKISGRDGMVLIEGEPKGPDKWLYPRLPLPSNRRAPPGCQALCFTFTLLEGEGQFRVLFDEENGSGYIVDFPAQPKRGTAMEVVALLDGATHGDGWSKPDPNGRLDPEQVVAVKIGCNTKAGMVKFTVANLRWVKFRFSRRPQKFLAKAGREKGR